MGDAGECAGAGRWESMRTLSEIIDSVRSGERPEYDELRYAVCALEALQTFDSMAFTRILVKRANVKIELEERHRRIKTALQTNPKAYVGWNNDPDNPEFVKRRRASIAMFEKITKGDA